MHQKLKKLARAACVAGCTLALAGCQRGGKSGAEAKADPTVREDSIVFPDKSPQLAVLGVEAARASTNTVLRLNGRLSWNDDVTVRVFSPFAGRVTQLQASPGARVEKGDALAVISSPDFGQAQADRSKAATDLALAERNAVRLRELAEHGAAAAKDLAAAEADLERARAESARARARIALFGASSNVIDNEFILRSPIVGVVVERSINPGQEVRPDQMLAGVEKLAAPLFTVTDPGRLWLNLDITEGEAALLAVGQKLRLRSSSNPGRVFQAVLEYESDSLDPVTRTIRARAVVDNSERQLKAEQLVTVEASTDATASVVDVPQGAVYLKSGSHRVFVETSPGAFAWRKVTAGACQGDHVQVLAGLRVGERVVTDGVMLLEQLAEGAVEEPAPVRTETAAISRPAQRPL